MGKIGHIATHRALIDYCRERFDFEATDRLIRAAGIDPRLFDDPDGTIDEAGRRALWTQAYTMTRDPDLALHVPEFRTFAELDGLAGSAPSVGAAFEDQCEFWSWFDRSSFFSFEHAGHEVGVSIEMADGGRPSRVRAQYGLADLYIGIRKVTHVDFVPTRVEFSSTAPRDASELQRIFAGAQPSFDRPKDKLWLRAEDWKRAVGHDRHYRRNPLWLVHAAEAESADTLATDVRRIVKDRVGNEPISLNRVARRLSMSPRTLQRRLSQEGVSFAEVVDHARRTRACTLLQGRTHSIAAITFLVGFSEQSAFTRAFRRWTATTPARYRRGLRLPAAAPDDAAFF